MLHSGRYNFEKLYQFEVSSIPDTNSPGSRCDNLRLLSFTKTDSRNNSCGGPLKTSIQHENVECSPLLKYKSTFINFYIDQLVN